MTIKFTPSGWNDYVYWQIQDRKTLKRINRLLEDISRGSGDALGKPETLLGSLAGRLSRRIDEKNRLIYRIVEDASAVEVVQCRGHYDDT
ncbi:MAG: Txe/YoeB family addiction module toxin [Oscillospiraceae bacterium]|jgi:toxin YoeB|nr:Txe/YoeB family addiction module toxin [Oscillospiraceae bacterium]